MYSPTNLLITPYKRDVLQVKKQLKICVFEKYRNKSAYKFGKYNFQIGILAFLATYEAVRGYKSSLYKLIESLDEISQVAENNAFEYMRQFYQNAKKAKMPVQYRVYKV